MSTTRMAIRTKGHVNVKSQIDLGDHINLRHGPINFKVESEPERA